MPANDTRPTRSPRVVVYHQANGSGTAHVALGPMVELGPRDVGQRQPLGARP